STAASTATSSTTTGKTPTSTEVAQGRRDALRGGVGIGLGVDPADLGELAEPVVLPAHERPRVTDDRGAQLGEPSAVERRAARLPRNGIEPRRRPGVPERDPRPRADPPAAAQRDHLLDEPGVEHAVDPPLDPLAQLSPRPAQSHHRAAPLDREARRLG